MLRTIFLMEVTDHHLFQSDVVSNFTLANSLDCTKTAKALSVPTVESDGNIIKKRKNQNFLVGLLLHRNDVFIPPCAERLHGVGLQFDLQNFIEGQRGFMGV